MTSVQMRERADYYFRRAREEGDDPRSETFIDIAIDFDKIALDLEIWGKGEFQTPRLIRPSSVLK